MVAGGIKEKYHRSVNIGWWYTPIRNSKSWSVADKFVKYWGTFKTYKKGKKRFYNLTKKIKKGDILAADWNGDGIWNHLAYISDKSGKKRKKHKIKFYNLKIAQHTNDYNAWLTNTKVNGWVKKYKVKRNKKIAFAILKRI